MLIWLAMAFAAWALLLTMLWALYRLTLPAVDETADRYRATSPNAAAAQPA
jgi:hypothetical protein